MCRFQWKSVFTSISKHFKYDFTSFVRTYAKIKNSSGLLRNGYVGKINTFSYLAPLCSMKGSPSWCSTLGVSPKLNTESSPASSKVRALLTTARDSNANWKRENVFCYLLQNLFIFASYFNIQGPSGANL